ncbi:MAG: glycoside hydrolase family 32 protein [Chitinophagales bacterium]
MILLLFAACQSDASIQGTTDTIVHTTPVANQEFIHYGEPHRPQFHFSPEEKWMNAPSGMFYLDGEYHLFHQHHPESTTWGPMHWGHAVSKDLIHWSHLPIALAPDSLGYIFSGSTVVDHNNTSGFQEGQHPPVVALFTYHDASEDRAGDNGIQSQGIAFSNDKGQTWTKYANNPVIPNTDNIRNFRDPKVFWHEESKKWVMILASGDRVMLYKSPDLKNWTKTSEFGTGKANGSHGGLWESPDLFELKVEGNENESRWIMLVSIGNGAPNGGSGTQYFVGDFDGETFTLDPVLSTAYRKVLGLVPQGEVIADFEKDYGKWKKTGKAFGKTPARGKIGKQGVVSGFSGKGLVNTHLHGNASKGKLISPTFSISQPFINFQIGGGYHKGKTCINLLVDGKIVRTARGSGTERLDWKHWEVADLKDKTAQIEIVDEHTGDWGYILVDKIVLANKAAKGAREQSIWLDYGRDNYAGVTWSNVPTKDGRRLFMGWMSNWQYAQDVPTEKWRGAMTTTRELLLRKTQRGLRVISQPVKELEQLRGKSKELGQIQLPENTEKDLTTLLPFSTTLSEARFRFEAPVNGTVKEYGIILSNKQGDQTTIGFDVKKNQYFVDRTQSGKIDFSQRFDGKDVAPRLVRSRKTDFHLLLDRSSVELFADNGAVVMTECFFPNEDYNQMKLYTKGGNITLQSVQIQELKRIWEDK